MSGGSYEYLYIKDSSELFGLLGQLESMSQRLAGLGYAPDAARETEEILLICRQFQNVVDLRLRRLCPIWKAVEWWDSGDWGEAPVKEALKAYRTALDTEDEG